MKLQYIGHAGILVKEQQCLIAIDPFISGTFCWNGKVETYKGASPWIGINQEKFIQTFGPQLTAIAITHAHGDHCDINAIIRLLQINPEIQLFAPWPIIDWLKVCSIWKPKDTKNLIKVLWNHDYRLNAQEGELTLGILPNARVPRCRHPHRVGYTIENNHGMCIAHVGDTHGVGPWKQNKMKITDLVLWGDKQRKEIIQYFIQQGVLKRIWWIHWEMFTPGNFSCSQNVEFLMKELKTSSIKQEIPPYNEWIGLN